MRFLFLTFVISLVSTFSFALTSSDDVVCSGGMWKDKHVYLHTENSEGHKNLLLLFCDGPCSQPPYYFEKSLHLKPMAETYAALGEMIEQLDPTGDPQQYFKRGKALGRQKAGRASRAYFNSKTF